MSEEVRAEAIHQEGSSSEEQWQPNHTERKPRFPRACTARTANRLYPAAPDVERKPSSASGRKEKGEQQQCSKIITPLVQPPPASQLPRWSLRSMWELASLLDFLHAFRPLLNIAVEFSAEELETALITPNSTLDDVHIPLLRAIPPVTRMALGRATWVTVLCRKLKDWWHWVADGEIPIVASHGMEVETYKTLDPATRVLILKALCDIRVEQEDIRSYIDSSFKHGVQLSAFRRERIGGDSHGISYWYEDDPIIGHRLYREIRRVEGKKMKSKGVSSLPLVSYQWETVATNLDEFLEVSDKLLSSKNRTECALGKRLKIDILPEVEKVQKRKEKLLKKQHRQALLLDSYVTADGLTSGRSLRDRKPVTYTFDDFDRSINEAIKITKKRQPSPEQHDMRRESVRREEQYDMRRESVRREAVSKSELSMNGKWNDPSQVSQHVSNDAHSPKSTEYEETDGEHTYGPLDRSDRRRKRPQRYSEKEFVEAVSDNEADFDSDDDIVGEAVYDEEYLRNRKQKKVSSSSEGDEEYRWEDENTEEEEEEADDSLSVSGDNDERHRYKHIPSRSRQGTKLRSVGELQSGLRRSKRTGPRFNYRQYEQSDTDGDSRKPDKSKSSNGHSDAIEDLELSTASQDSQDEDDVAEMKDLKDLKEDADTMEEVPDHSVEKTCSPDQAAADGVQRRRYLDLNELAPSAGFDDVPTATMKDESADDI